MALKISMLSKLETTKNFKLVAGAGGLEKTIDCTEILDFEFDQLELVQLVVEHLSY